MLRNVVITCKILQKEAGIDDAKYRQILWEIAKVKSSKELSQEMGLRVIKVLEDMKPEKPAKKPIIDVSTLYKSVLKKSEPWKISYNLSEENWNRIGLLIGEYAERGITVVAIWPAYGQKYIKWRKT